MPVRDDIAKEFDYSRQKAKENVDAGVQQKRDAIARKRAQLGGGPGGAMIKAEQQAMDQGGKQLADANSQIDSAQRGEMRRIGEIEEGRAYQTKEREAGQTFQSGEAGLQRNWMTGERMGSQEFATGERESSQRWNTGEREAGQTFSREERLGSQTFAHDEADIGLKWQGGQNDIDRKQQQGQFDSSLGLEWNRLDHQKGVDQFNMELATKMANEKDMFEQMFAGAGSAFKGLGEVKNIGRGDRPSFGGLGGSVRGPSMSSPKKRKFRV